MSYDGFLRAVAGWDCHKYKGLLSRKLTWWYKISRNTSSIFKWMYSFIFIHIPFSCHLQESVITVLSKQGHPLNLLNPDPWRVPLEELVQGQLARERKRQWRWSACLGLWSPKKTCKHMEIRGFQPKVWNRQKIKKSHRPAWFPLPSPVAWQKSCSFPQHASWNLRFWIGNASSMGAFSIAIFVQKPGDCRGLVNLPPVLFSFSFTELP